MLRFPAPFPYEKVVNRCRAQHQINTSGQHVQANVLPRVRQALGIVSGFWMTDMAGATLMSWSSKAKMPRDLLWSR